MKRKNKDKVMFAPEDTKYWALQAKDGHLFSSLTGKVMVTTHKMPIKGYKVVELRVVESEKKRRQPSKNRYDDL